MKPRKQTKVTVPKPTFDAYCVIVSCGIYVAASDENGKLWLINLESGHAKPITFGKSSPLSAGLRHGFSEGFRT